MSPVDPVFLKRVQIPAKRTGEGASCVSCGYDLAGLDGIDRCPECGEPFEPVLGRRAHTPGQRTAARFHVQDRLTDASIGYLRAMLMGVVLLAVSLPVMQASLFALRWGVMDLTSASILLIVVGLVWWLGVLITTGPRRSSRATAAQMSNEYRLLRVVNRTVQSFWCIAGGAALLIAMMPGSRLASTASALYMLLVLGGMFGFAPLCEQLRSIALWGHNEGLGERLNFAAWGVAGFGAYVLVAPFIAAFAGPLGILVGYSALIASILFAFANIVLMVSLFQFVPMFRWSILNWSAARERTRRQLEQFEDRQAGVPEPAPVVRPRPIAVFDESPIPLAGDDAPCE